MTTTTKKLFPLWLICIVYLILYFTNAMTMAPLLNVWALGLSIYLLIKNKFPSFKYIIISVVLSVVATVPLFFVQQNFKALTIVYILLTFLTALFSILAILSVMEKYGDFELIYSEGKWSPLFSVLIGLGVGIVLGAIYFLLLRNGQDGNFRVEAKSIMMAFNSGIYGELALRAIFMAFCFYICRGTKLTKFQSFTMWFMMSVPDIFGQGNNYNFVSCLILCIVIALPLAILQRKRDLTSSMVAHGIMDLIRFVIFGL